MARSLSVDFRGDIPSVADDFNRLVEFCVSTDHLGLPRPECGNFAARVAQKGEKLSGGIAAPFISLFSFLTSETGPKLTTGQALLLSERLMSAGKDSADNFIQAFKYGISSRGLGFNTRDALRFAQDMTLQNGG